MTTKQVIKEIILGGIKVTLFELILGPYHRVKLIKQLSVIDSKQTHFFAGEEVDLAHISPLQLIKRIYNEQGVLALYRGSLSHVLFLFPAKGLTRYIKHHANRFLIPYLTPYIHQSTKKDFWRELISELISDSFAKFISLFILYPFEVSFAYEGRDLSPTSDNFNVFGRLNDIWNKDGAKGLYSGFLISYLFLLSKNICKASFQISSYYIFHKNPFEKPLVDPTQELTREIKPTTPLTKDRTVKYNRNWKSMILNQLVSSMINFYCYPLDTLHKVMIFHPNDRVDDLSLQLIHNVGFFSLFRGSLISTLQLNLRFAFRLVIESFKH